MQTKYGLTSLCDPNCGVQSMNRHTDKRTERKVKAKGPKIMYRYLLYSSSCNHWRSNIIEEITISKHCI